MTLASDQLVLDTNILVHWLRGKDAGTKLRSDYALGSRTPRPIVPVVVKAEIKSLALKFNWGAERQEALDQLLRELPVAEISSEHVISAYAELDNEARKRGRRTTKACASWHRCSAWSLPAPPRPTRPPSHTAKQWTPHSPSATRSWRAI